MTLPNKDELFNYSNISFTACYEDNVGQYYFIINRLLMELNMFLTKKSAFIDLYHVDVCPISNIPTLHFVIERNISNKELDAYLDFWTLEFKKVLKLKQVYEND